MPRLLTSTINCPKCGKPYKFCFTATFIKRIIYTRCPYCKRPWDWLVCMTGTDQFTVSAIHN